MENNFNIHDFIRFPFIEKWWIKPLTYMTVAYSSIMSTTMCEKDKQTYIYIYLKTSKIGVQQSVL